MKVYIDEFTNLENYLAPEQRWGKLIDSEETLDDATDNFLIDLDKAFTIFKVVVLVFQEENGDSIYAGHLCFVNPDTKVHIRNGIEYMIVYEVRTSVESRMSNRRKNIYNTLLDAVEIHAKSKYNQGIAVESPVDIMLRKVIDRGYTEDGDYYIKDL